MPEPIREDKVFMPMASPWMLTSGPPLFPGNSGASV